MEQGTQAWLDYRRTKLGSSDCPVILGVSPWSTPHKLWLEKTKRVTREQKSNYAMERGNRWEPAARALYELQSGMELPPAIVVSKEYKFLSASLDGYSKDAGVVLEIKIPGAEVFDAAVAGKIHKKYYPQVMFQLHCAGAKEAHFFCCKVEKIKGQEQITETALVIVKPDEKFIKEMLIALIGFWDFVQKDIPPPLSPEDTVLLDDESSVVLFARLKNIRVSRDTLEAEYDEIKARLKDLDNELDDVMSEAIEHCESYGHTRFSCLDMSLVKNKKQKWNLTLKDESSAEVSTLK